MFLVQDTNNFQIDKHVAMATKITVNVDVLSIYFVFIYRASQEETQVWTAYDEWQTQK